VIKWTAQAAQQLDQAHDYIALSNSKEVSAQITMQIVTSVQQLAAFPMSGSAGRVPGTREMVISNTPSIAAYAIEKVDIVVLAVYHVAQHWLEDFESPPV
jgi:addiction module RelE/StbE family toxin